MTYNELTILKEIASEQYEQYSDGFEILLEGDISVYTAFKIPPESMHTRPQKPQLSTTERLAHTMGFIDALAWATRNGHLDIDSFPTTHKAFEDPEETPEERAEFYENRYKGLSPEARAELEAFDKESAELWAEYIEQRIIENIVLNELIVKLITGED